MKTINIAVTIYTIDELEDEARELAIQEHRDFLVDVFNEDMYDECFEMTQEKYEEELTEEDVVENIKINDYRYYANGEMARTLRYTGKHPRSGEHVLIHNNVEYSIA